MPNASSRASKPCWRGISGAGSLCSDFLSDGDVERAIGALFAKGLESFAVQILAPAELDPELNGDLRLRDAENGETLDVSGVGHLMDIYRDYLQRYQDRVAQAARRRSGRHLCFSSAEELQQILTDRLLRRGWLR